MLGESLGYTDVIVLGSYEFIKLELFYGKLIGNILVNNDGITHELDVGTELTSLDGSFDGSNDGTLEELLIGDSLETNDCIVLRFDEGIKLGSSDR